MKVARQWGINPLPQTRPPRGTGCARCHYTRPVANGEMARVALGDPSFSGRCSRCLETARRRSPAIRIRICPSPSGSIRHGSRCVRRRRIRIPKPIRRGRHRNARGGPDLGIRKGARIPLTVIPGECERSSNETRGPGAETQSVRSAFGARYAGSRLGAPPGSSPGVAGPG